MDCPGDTVDCVTGPLGMTLLRMMHAPGPGHRIDMQAAWAGAVYEVQHSPAAMDAPATNAFLMLAPSRQAGHRSETRILSNPRVVKAEQGAGARQGRVLPAARRLQARVDMTSILAPTPTRPARLAPLAKLPIFLDLAGRRALVVGGGEPVVWKVELLLAAGAALTILAEEPHPDLEALAAAPPPSPTAAERSHIRLGANPLPDGERPSAPAGAPGEGEVCPPESVVPPHPALSPSGRGFPTQSLTATPTALPAAEGWTSGRVRLVRRPWEVADLAGVALVVADIDDGAEAARLALACRARGVPLNVIDKPAFCDFQFGTIVNRSPVVIGIMTDGAAPILGQAIRRRIEAVLPASLSSWARSAKAFRDRLKALLPSREGRRAFWERFTDAAFASAAPEAQHRDIFERWAGEVARGRGEGRIGEVAIVGAGPGDPELLTLKAMRELQAADVIVYDRLVTPAVLELGRREARRIHVGKEGHGASCRQEDISALLVDLALAGERVVRLKGGDPALFGRTGEEVEACRAAGVPVRIVPGVTSASAAVASLDLSLTHRDRAGRVQFITGHDRSGDLPADLDDAGLADPRSTLVVFMGRRHAARLARRLLDRGLAGATPVLAVSDASRPDQATLRTDLAGLAEGVSLPEGRPVIILIGAALKPSPTQPSRIASFEAPRSGAPQDEERAAGGPRSTNTGPACSDVAAEPHPYAIT